MYKLYFKSKAKPPGYAFKILLTMKLTTLLIIAAMLQVSAASKAQTATLSEKNAPLKAVFNTISDQTGYDFVVSTSVLKLAAPVTITVKDKSLKTVLDEIFTNQPLQYQLQEKTVIVTKKEGVSKPEQTTAITPLTITGRVQDSLGKPLAGATLKNLAVGIAVTTDVQGQFSLQGSNGDKVQVSFVGYTPYTFEIHQQQADLVITLNPLVSKLSEVAVVSTGYQTIPRERSTGSFEQLSREQLNNRVSTDILSKMDGMSSVLFDKRNPSSTNLQIRGLYTLTQSISQPLIILDNFPYEGDVNNINPNDIENITLLKDAAAASIWGAKAGNGVIVINSKKGRFNQPTKVSINSSVSFSGKPDLFNLPVIPSSDMINLEIALFKQGAYDANINNTSTYSALTPVVEILNDRRAGLISSADSATRIDALRKNDVRNDFSKYIYRQQVSQQHQVDISGGSKDGNYRVSAGYDRNIYDLIGNTYKRYTFNSYSNFKPFKNFQVQAGVQYVQSNSTNNNLGDYGSSNYDLNGSVPSSSGPILPIYSQLADAAGDHLTINKYRNGFIDTVGRGKLLNWADKPLDDLDGNNNVTVSRSFLADAGLRLSPYKFLNFELKYRYQRVSVSNENNHNIDSYFARDLINQFTNLNATSASQKYPIPLGGILSTNESDIETHNVRGQLNFNENISSLSNLSVIAGAEINRTTTNGFNNTIYGYSSRLSSANVDFVNTYPRILGGSSTVPISEGFTDFDNRYVSVFANAAYTYKNRYVLSGSARNDATNLFGVETRNRWKPLYSVGGSWTLSDEPFYKFTPLSYLRLRVTYGYQGNINNTISGSTIINYVSASTNRPLNIPAAEVFQPANPQLRWENIRQVNFATDFEFWNGKIKGSLEYYLKDATDVLAAEDADPTTGYSQVFRNSANISGKGFEISLISKNIVKESFSWQTSLQTNFATYKVTKYLVNSSTNGIVSDGQVITPIVGYSPYALISYKLAGLDPLTGDPLGYVNGTKSKDWDNIVYNTPLSEQAIQGSALPLIYGNLANDFRLGNFKIWVNIIYKLDYYFRRPTIYYGGLFSNGAGNSDYLKRWQKPGDELVTNIPSMVYPNPTTSRDAFYMQSDATVEKGDNVKLQTIQVSYDLLKAVHQKFGFTQFEIFANADNMNYIIWCANKKNIDPDYPTGLKMPASISAGIRAAF